MFTSEVSAVDVTGSMKDDLFFTTVSERRVRDPTQINSSYDIQCPRLELWRQINIKKP